MTSFKKNLACEILRLRRIAFATDFLTAAVRSLRSVFISWDAISYETKSHPALGWFFIHKLSFPETKHHLRQDEILLASVFLSAYNTDIFFHFLFLANPR